MLQKLQKHDEDIESVVAYSRFTSVFCMQWNGTNPEWQKADTEGPLALGLFVFGQAKNEAQCL